MKEPLPRTKDCKRQSSTRGMSHLVYVRDQHDQKYSFQREKERVYSLSSWASDHTNHTVRSIIYYPTGDRHRPFVPRSIFYLCYTKYRDSNRALVQASLIFIVKRWKPVEPLDAHETSRECLRAFHEGTPLNQKREHFMTTQPWLLFDISISRRHEKEKRPPAKRGRSWTPKVAERGVRI